MKHVVPALLVLLCTHLLAGCWVAHTAHDRPELRANIGRTATLTKASTLIRDGSGRLHLDGALPLSNPTLVAQLPAGTVIRIKDVLYRVSDPGRRDYYLIEVEAATERFTVEVPAEERSRPVWQYDAKG